MNNYANLQGLMQTLRSRYLRLEPIIDEVVKLEAKITELSMVSSDSPISESEFNDIKNFITLIKSIKNDSVVALLEVKSMETQDEIRLD